MPNNSPPMESKDNNSAPSSSSSNGEALPTNGDMKHNGLPNGVSNGVHKALYINTTESPNSLSDQNNSSNSSPLLSLTLSPKSSIMKKGNTTPNSGGITPSRVSFEDLKHELNDSGEEDNAKDNNNEKGKQPLLANGDLQSNQPKTNRQLLTEVQISSLLINK